MKQAFMLGMGLGFVLGNYAFKKCPSVQKAVDNAENAVKQKVDECKSKMQKNNQAPSGI